MDKLKKQEYIIVNGSFGIFFYHSVGEAPENRSVEKNTFNHELRSSPRVWW